MVKHNILIVEDDQNILQELKKNLEDEGYDVDPADNGRTAFNLWKKNIYDLVLVDLRIPEIDGRDLIDKIKSRQPYTQIIILSGQGMEDDLIDAVNKHVFKYLKKPVDLEEFLCDLGDENIIVVPFLRKEAVRVKGRSCVERR
jgi:two-component system alkaline phosphatase synthesis response regulator PhoP